MAQVTLALQQRLGLISVELSVNLNKVALLRNSRGGNIPDLLTAARTVLRAGAYGITVHPRPDQRHTRASDVPALARLLADEFPSAELNIEGNPSTGPRANGFPGFAALIERARPAQVTLVPDSDAQLTSDHGWDLSGDNTALERCIAQFRATGARVSLFMDPDLAQIRRVPDIGAQRIELYTGPFAATVLTHGAGSQQARESLTAYRAAAEEAAALGLGVNAGHDLDLINLPLFATIPEILEVSIGHALVADALYLGLAAAVTAYLNACRGPNRAS
jgi:pyridoxine 5-phosphate synthase